MKTVLIIEDQALVQRALARLCKLARALWQVANNGQEALDYLRENPAPSLIICDIDMPVMTGPEFVLRRGAIDGLVDVPLILYAGGVNVDTVAAQLGVAHYRKGGPIAPLLEDIRRYTRSDAGMPAVVRRSTDDVHPPEGSVTGESAATFAR
jgi:CheY-like chemotaxis protein